MKKALALALFAFCVSPIFADVKLDTSISDVYNRGTNELTGSISWTVTDDDFRDASTDEPIFIRVTPDHNSSLAETLVRQSSSDPVQQLPIHLAMRLDGGNGFTQMAALPDAISIVRWVEGESSLWIRVQQTSDQWLTNAGGLLGPSRDLEVAWTIGISARTSDTRNIDGAAANGSNLPFNTRDISAGEGDFEDATSTLICVDLSASNLLADGTEESQLKYDIIALDYNADLGGGVYSRQQGNDTGINFTNDFRIARGKDRACSVISVPAKDGEVYAYLCVNRSAENETAEQFVQLCNELTIEIECESGGSYLSTDLVSGSYISFATPSNSKYGFYESGTSVRFTDGTAGGRSLSSNFSTHGRTLYHKANLVYLGGNQLLSSAVDLTMEVCVWMHYSEAATEATVDWDVVLLNHTDAYDDEPYYDPTYAIDGDYADQNRRCEPSAFTLDGETFVIGWYLDCTGTPVSIFFPYMPIITGNSDFWVGLSYVNQGFVDLDVEAIYYDEAGNRFAGDLGTLAERNQKTWLIIEGADGVSTISGAGLNNAGVSVTPAPDNADQTAADFGTTRGSLFVRGTFGAEFVDEISAGDLDGYMLVGNAATSSIDGAYLARNYDNDVAGQNADLPLHRSKMATAKKTITSPKVVDLSDLNK